jgi:hypothetical protein
MVVLALVGSFATYALAASDFCLPGTHEESNDALSATWCADTKGDGQGWWIRTYPSGMPMLAGHDVRGKHDGHWLMFHDNGEPQEEQIWKNGSALGTWTGWHRNGRRAWVIKYVDDEEVSRACWNEHGSERPCPKEDEESSNGKEPPEEPDAKTLVTNLGRSLVFFGGKPVVDATLKAAKSLCDMQYDEIAMVRRFVKSCPGAEARGIVVVGEPKCDVKKQLDFARTVDAHTRDMKARERVVFAQAATAAAKLPMPAVEVYQDLARTALSCFCPEGDDGHKGPCASAESEKEAWQ